MLLARLFFAVVCLSLVTQTACVRRHADTPVDLEVLRHGGLEDGGDAISPIVYVNVRDRTNRLFGLRSRTEQLLQQAGYSVAANPSEAGHILHISVLGAGKSAREDARALVDAGYGAAAHFSGQDGSALAADVLLVQRNIPQARRPSRQKLKNISHRNAVDNSQMRIALFTRREMFFDAGLPSAVVDFLARELATAMPRAGGGEAPASPTENP